MGSVAEWVVRCKLATARMTPSDQAKANDAKDQDRPMSYRIASDLDVQAYLGMPEAVASMEDTFRRQAEGALVAPGRIVSDVRVGQLVFTVGARTEPTPIVGFRVYDFKHLASPKRAELVAVFNADDGALKGLVIGPLLGAVRTGAIGGVAIKYLARADAECLGLIGTGYQARTQLEAAVTVRPFKSIKAFSRDARRRNQFADRMSEKLGREVRAVDSAQQAVDGADVLICATTSATPVIEAGWLKTGVHVNNIGPKFKNQHELGLDVMSRCCQLITDTRAQMAAYEDQFILHGTPLAGDVDELCQLVAGTSAGRTSDEDHTLFCSLGLAGTEVMLADRLLERMAAERRSDGEVDDGT